jgi:hypothetical protein
MNRVETLSFAHSVHLYRLSLKKTAHVITLLLMTQKIIQEMKWL